MKSMVSLTPIVSTAFHQIDKDLDIIIIYLDSLQFMNDQKP